MILKEVLEKSTNYLKHAGFETPRLDCELLFSHALSMSRVDLYLKFDDPLSEDEIFQAMRTVTTDRPLYSQLRDGTCAQADRYNWDSSAAAMAGVMIQ